MILTGPYQITHITFSKLVLFTLNEYRRGEVNHSYLNPISHLLWFIYYRCMNKGLNNVRVQNQGCWKHQYQCHFDRYWYQSFNGEWVPVPLFLCPMGTGTSIFGTDTKLRVLPRNGRFCHFSPTKLKITPSKLMYIITHHGIQLKQLQKWVKTNKNPLYPS